MRRSLLIAFALLLVSVGIATAASGDQGRRLSGPFCIDGKSGVVRSVALLHTGKCRKGEVRRVGVGDPLPTVVNGTDGAVGATGATGATGPKGDKGDTGATGPAGVPGVNDPLVFGPYDSGSSDSSVCGNDWADDTYTRTYIVDPQSDGSFEVTELYRGTFVTREGLSPNDCEVEIPAGIEGTFYGDYAMLVPAGADFDFTATCPPGCNGDAFFAAFFDTTFPSTYAWQFHYRTDEHGSWDNTDHGNSGNITP